MTLKIIARCGAALPVLLALTACSIPVSDVPHGCSGIKTYWHCTSSETTITGHGYDEIWAAALKVAEEHFRVSVIDKSQGVITAERDVWRPYLPFWPQLKEKGVYVGIHITPPAPGADQYVLEVVQRDPYSFGHIDPPGISQDWGSKVPRNIQEVLAGQPMSHK